MRSPDHAILNKIYNLKFDSVVNIFTYLSTIYHTKTCFEGEACFGYSDI